MAINPVAMNAYKAAMQTGPNAVSRQSAAASRKSAAKPEQARATFDIGFSGKSESFGNMINNSLKQVNDLQTKKKSMIEEFASGEKQNVHELMISLQKAGLAMKMTSTVRNKVMEAYKSLSHMQF